MDDVKELRAISVSKVVEEKLLQGEKPIAEIPAANCDFVATDRRLLRFSTDGCEALDYAAMSGISYKIYHGKRIAARIVLGFCMALSIYLGLVIGIMGMISPADNMSRSQAAMVMVVFLALAAFAFVAIKTVDFGFYQVDSRMAGGLALEDWRFPTHPFTRRRIDHFIGIVKERIASWQNEEIVAAYRKSTQPDAVPQEEGKSAVISKSRQAKATSWPATLGNGIGAGLAAGLVASIGPWAWGAGVIVFFSVVVFPGTVKPGTRRLAAIGIAVFVGVVIAALLQIGGKWAFK